MGRSATTYLLCAVALVLGASACASEKRADAAKGASVETGGAEWRLVWSDEFDGDALDPAKWTPEESCWGGGNDERQCYTGRTANVRIENGSVVLAARPEAHEGPLNPAHYGGANDETGRQEYTSGKIITFGKADWRYGRFSARIKLPAGQGAWSAFWMMPTESAYGAWPRSGEIDIMEAVNIDTPCADCRGGVEHRTSGALHFGDLAPANTYLTSMADQQKPAGPADEWHVYTLEWAEGVLQWFVDDKIFMRLDENDWWTGAESKDARAPFDRPFYLNLNLAVGGRLAEDSNSKGFDPKTFPAEMLVDWVRVEQCAGDVETGRACLSDQEWAGTPHGPAGEQAP